MTVNPAYMDEFRNFDEPLRPLYGQISNDEQNAREKVYHRVWYEPEYTTKARFADDCEQDLVFPALMQEFTYLMDTTDNPAAAPPGAAGCLPDRDARRAAAPRWAAPCRRGASATADESTRPTAARRGDDPPCDASTDRRGLAEQALELPGPGRGAGVDSTATGPDNLDADGRPSRRRAGSCGRGRDLTRPRPPVRAPCCSTTW
jgi:hypothetical protein